MYYLKMEKDVPNVIGYLNYPSIRKKVKIELSSEKEEELIKVLEGIKDIIGSRTVPKPKKSRICRKCAYFEFCFS